MKNGIKDYCPTQENNTYTSQNAKILHSEHSVRLPELEARSKVPCPTPLQGRKEGTLCVSKDQAARLHPRVHNFCNGRQSATTLCCCHKYSYCFFCIDLLKKNKNNKCHASSSSSGNCFWYYELVQIQQPETKTKRIPVWYLPYVNVQKLILSYAGSFILVVTFFNACKDLLRHVF